MSDSIKVKEELQRKCMLCTEEFFNLVGKDRIFPYERCKRCPTGIQLHELDQNWICDYVKRDC